MRRRTFLKRLTFGALAALVAGSATAGPAPDRVRAQLALLEQRHGGRLGVAILDTGSGWQATYRGDEAFLMCSTFKVLLVATVLARVDAGQEQPDRRIVYGKDVLLDWAPITTQHVGPPGVTVLELCAAAVTQSDNTAANLLLASAGGPAAVTRYARSLGDVHTVLDRIEPAMNAYDTTTPRAMLADLRQVLLGAALSATSRRRLTDWMLDCRTGSQSLRAGVPRGWRVGDKTGQWDGDGVGANNDLAIIWPPSRKPWLVAAYYTTKTADVGARKAVLAAVGRIVAARPI